CRDDDQRPAREVLLERDEDPLEHGDSERDLQPPLTQPATGSARALDGRLRHARNLPRWRSDPDSPERLDLRPCAGGPVGVVEEGIDGRSRPADVCADGPETA